MPRPIAYLPLDTQHAPLSDAAVRSAVDFAVALGLSLFAAPIAVRAPRVASPLGAWLLDVPSLARAAEERSQAACIRLEALVRAAAGDRLPLHVAASAAALGETSATAAQEARYFDLALVPAGPGVEGAAEMAQAVVFGAGRPVVLVPEAGAAAAPARAAIAWDESRVAARALGDALALLPEGVAWTVLTVQDEKPLARAGLARTLAESLGLRGRDARPVEVELQGRDVAAALQDAALAEGAGLLVMGGFGHSRLRDFVLGGATRAVLDSQRLPVLLSH